MQAVYLDWVLNPEPLNTEQGKSLFSHDCAFHWMHHQGKTFIIKAYSQVYQILGPRTAAIHAVHTILSHY